MVNFQRSASQPDSWVAGAGVHSEMIALILALDQPFWLDVRYFFFSLL